MLNMKVKQNSESSYVFGYLLELIIKIWQFENFFLQYLANLCHFFIQNPLHKLKSYFSSQNLGKFQAPLLPPKKNKKQKKQSTAIR
jgi:hypothetical protein